LSIHILPAIDRNFPFHLSNLFLIFSMTLPQKLVLRWLPPTSISRYVKGTFITSQLRIDAYIHNWGCLTLTPPNRLFEKLTFSPETNSKQHSIDFMTITLWVLSLQKKIVSSAKCSMLTFTFLVPTSTLRSISLSTACLTTPINPFATTKNRKG